VENLRLNRPIAGPKKPLQDLFSPPAEAAALAFGDRKSLNTELSRPCTNPILDHPCGDRAQPSTVHFPPGRIRFEMAPVSPLGDVRDHVDLA
jgi:hypothetical protein